MEYLFYGRDRPDTAELRLATIERHWSFIDAYSEALVARGPTLSPEDPSRMTGSVHLIDLPDPESAQVFGYEEPFYKAGVFEQLLVRRWSNALGRTMWQFTGSGGSRFFVLGHGAKDAGAERERLHETQRDYLQAEGFCSALIACGPMLSDSGTGWLGSALMVELADAASVKAMIARSPYGQSGLYARLEIHPWRFGGRPAGP